jgi:hypothetical protein
MDDKQLLTIGWLIILIELLQLIFPTKPNFPPLDFNNEHVEHNVNDFINPHCILVISTLHVHCLLVVNQFLSFDLGHWVRLKSTNWIS